MVQNLQSSHLQESNIVRDLSTDLIIRDISDIKELLKLITMRTKGRNHSQKIAGGKTYKISKLVQLPILSGIVPVKLLPRTSLEQSEKILRS